VAISSRRAGSSHLREAIKAYRALWKGSLEPWALDLLARLADSPDAAEAYERLRLGDRQDEFGLLHACIGVELLARTFPQRIKKLKETLERGERLREAVAALRVFVGEFPTKPEPPNFDLVLQNMWDLPANIAAMKDGLELISKRIELIQCVAKEDEVRLGKNRKAHTKKAAENAAIWWLASAVRTYSGKTNRKEVADLAQVILKTEVSVDRVSHAVRSRHQPL
jgi:hypothetical protein